MPYVELAKRLDRTESALRSAVHRLRRRYGELLRLEVAHFGLGDATKVTTLRIEWPSGIVQEFANQPVDEFRTSAGATHVFTDTKTTNCPTRFYRVLVP